MKQVLRTGIVVVAMSTALVAVTHGEQASSGSSDVVASAFSAEITGTVKNVNAKSGKLVLDTPDGAVNVKFPAEAVQGIKVGDPVTVSVALVKPAPSASPQTSPSTK